MRVQLKNQIRRRLLQVFAKTPRLEVLDQLMRLYCAVGEGEAYGDFRFNGEARLMRTLLPECGVVIDGGACVGDWSRLALGINPELELHCVEPLLKNHQRMISDSGLDKAKLHQLALGSENGHLKIDAKTQSIHRLDSGQVEEVEVLTLDSFCESQSIDQIDFLKLDLEGHELAALQGAKSLLERGKIKHIQFEYGPDHVFARIQLRDLFDFLMPYGFRFHKIIPSGLVEIPEYTTWLENYRYKNFYAVCE